MWLRPALLPHSVSNRMRKHDNRTVATITVPTAETVLNAFCTYERNKKLIKKIHAIVINQQIVTCNWRRCHQYSKVLQSVRRTPEIDRIVCHSSNRESTGMFGHYLAWMLARTWSAATTRSLFAPSSYRCFRLCCAKKYKILKYSYWPLTRTVFHFKTFLTFL